MSSYFYTSNYQLIIKTQGVLREAGNRSVEQLSQEESEILLGLLRLRASPGHG
jgi:hypothetical protein